MTLQTRILDLIAPSFMERMQGIEDDLAQTKARERVLADSLMTFGDVLRDEVINIRSPMEMITELQEQGFDQVLLQQLINQIGWDQISSLSTIGEDNKQERDAVTQHASRLFKYSPLAQWSIWLWTGWGLGDRVTVTLESDDAQKIWDEFATAERNEPVMGEDTIHELSDWLLVKGNRFVVLFTATTGDNRGQSTMRILPQQEITSLSNPEDKLDVWFYKRTYASNGSTTTEDLYYPDHRTLLAQGSLIDKRWNTLIEKKAIPSEAKRADREQNGTAVSILHIAHNRKDEDSPWGWPITTTAGAWVKGHKQFSEARLGVAMAIAQFVRRSRVQGGSRAVQSVLSQVASTLSRNDYLDTNPPGAAGSWHVENKASETTELPMRTGASDAKGDNELFSWMALLGMGLFPTSAGLDTSRWATALEMDKAQSMIFERYQKFWAAQFRSLVRAVLMLETKYGPTKLKDEDTKAQISTDTFSLSDYPDVSEAVAKQVRNMLTPYVQNGIIPDQTAKRLLALLWGLSLDALGTGVGRDLTTEKAFGVIEEDEEGGDNTQPSPEPAAGDEEDETEPGMESDYIDILRVAMTNLKDGNITADAFAEMMVAEIGEIYYESTTDPG